MLLFIILFEFKFYDPVDRKRLSLKFNLSQKDGSHNPILFISNSDHINLSFVYFSWSLCSTASRYKYLLLGCRAEAIGCSQLMSCWNLVLSGPSLHCTPVAFCDHEHIKANLCSSLSNFWGFSACKYSKMCDPAPVVVRCWLLGIPNCSRCCAICVWMCTNGVLNPNMDTKLPAAHNWVNVTNLVKQFELLK